MSKSQNLRIIDSYEYEGIFIPRPDEEPDTDFLVIGEYDNMDDDDMVALEWRISNRLRMEREALGMFHHYNREVMS